jgi:hypothetical protein
MKLRNLMRECREAALTGSVNLDDFMRSLESNDKSILGKLSTKEFKDEVRALAAESDLVDASQINNNDEEKPLFKAN